MNVPDVESIAGIRRRWGKLYTVTTTGGRRFLLLRDPSSERYLKAGVSLDDRDLEALAGPLARTAGMALAYRLIAARDRTEREVRSSLGREGIGTPEVVDEIVDTLRRQGYLDDRRFATQYVRYLVQHRPSGARLMRRKLREAGVSEEIAETEIREGLSPEREREMAEELARRSLARGERSGGSTASAKERAVRRVHGLLSRRGFSERIVNEICARILRGTMARERDGA